MTFSSAVKHIVICDSTEWLMVGHNFLRISLSLSCLPIEQWAFIALFFYWSQFLCFIPTEFHCCHVVLSLQQQGWVETIKAIMYKSRLGFMVDFQINPDFFSTKHTVVIHHASCGAAPRAHVLYYWNGLIRGLVVCTAPVFHDHRFPLKTSVYEGKGILQSHSCLNVSSHN